MLMMCQTYIHATKAFQQNVDVDDKDATGKRQYNIVFAPKAECQTCIGRSQACKRKHLSCIDLIPGDKLERSAHTSNGHSSSNSFRLSLSFALAKIIVSES